MLENVEVRATDELDHGTSREFRGTSVQTGIVPTNCGDTHVLAGVLCPSLAQETCFLDFLAEIQKSLQVWEIRVQLARVADISTVLLQQNFAKH